MKVFTGSIATETNTFAPLPTGRDGFEEFYFPAGSRAEMPGPFAAPLLYVRQQCAERGWSLTEGLVTFAQPAGTVGKALYESLRDELLADLKAAGPVDIVCLVLHGAMVADGYPDCEGDLLEAVRTIVGPATIVGVELDPHCHLTDRMMGMADVLVCFKEYPHTDIQDRAVELWTLCVDAAEGRIRPVMRSEDCRMLNMYYTALPEMAAFVERMKAAEGQGSILSVSLAHGFPWADVPDVGTKVLVVADKDGDAAASLASSLSRTLIDMRDRTMGTLLSIEQAITALKANPKPPIVLADGADNPGVGAPGDSTYILDAFIKAGIAGVAVAFLWDPIAVRFAKAVGEGADLDLRIGGKACRLSGQPMDLRVKVVRITENATYDFFIGRMPLGDVAVVEGAGITIVLTTVRAQCFSPNGLTDFGVDLNRHPIILVKSRQHFRAGFGPMAGTILSVEAPGVGSLDFASLPYSRLDRPLWPLDPNPWLGP